MIVSIVYLSDERSLVETMCWRFPLFCADGIVEAEQGFLTLRSKPPEDLSCLQVKPYAKGCVALYISVQLYCLLTHGKSTASGRHIISCTKHI